MGTISPQLAKKIADAKASAGGNNITDGIYIFLIKRLIVEQKFKGTMFIAEVDVVESEKVRDDVEPNKVGTAASYAVNLDSNVSAPGNMKQFILGTAGLDEATTTSEKFMEELQRLAGEGQGARGMLVACETYRKVTKTGPNAGKEGIYPRWSVVSAEDGNSETEIASRRKELDAAKK